MLLTSFDLEEKEFHKRIHLTFNLRFSSVALLLFCCIVALFCCCFVLLLLCCCFCCRFVVVLFCCFVLLLFFFVVVVVVVVVVVCLFSFVCFCWFVSFPPPSKLYVHRKISSRTFQLLFKRQLK